MEIALLTRGPSLYSSRSLYKACVARGHTTRIVDYGRCNLVLGGVAGEVYHKDRVLPVPDGIIPRIGSAMTHEGAALIRHFEGLQVSTTTTSMSLIKARDKLMALQELTRWGISVPLTVFAGSNASMEDTIRQVGGFPCVVKQIESTHGNGVHLVQTMEELRLLLEVSHRDGHAMLVQEFIREARGEDIRVFVVDGRIEGAMKRVARDGDFRSNLHQGGVAYKARLTDLGEALALRAASCLGLGVAGVDILESDRGPLVLEINASPGLEGIEKVTGSDIAGRIVEFLERIIRECRETEG